MITQELLDYIKGRLDAGESRDAISQSLAQTGWQADAIAEAWTSLEAQTTAPIQVESTVQSMPNMPNMPSMPSMIEMPVATNSSLHLRLLILIGILALILAGGGYFYWQSQNTPAETSAADESQSEESLTEELPQGIEAMSPMEDPTLLEDLPQAEILLEDPLDEETLVEEAVQLETSTSSGPKPKVKVKPSLTDEAL